MVASSDDSVVPVMSPPEAAMVKSLGSISQVPAVPPSARGGDLRRVGDMQMRARGLDEAALAALAALGLDRAAERWWCPWR